MWATTVCVCVCVCDSNVPILLVHEKCFAILNLLAWHINNSCHEVSSKCVTTTCTFIQWFQVTWTLTLFLYMALMQVVRHKLMIQKVNSVKSFGRMKIRSLNASSFFNHLFSRVCHFDIHFSLSFFLFLFLSLSLFLSIFFPTHQM